MGSGLANVRALAVDDDPDNVELLACILDGEGASVRTAGSAHDALAIVGDWTPDLLLVDISLPDVDGYELLRRLRERPALAHVPAVAITGHAYERDRQRAALAGFAVHVVKPFDVEALIHVLTTLVAPPAAPTGPAAVFERTLRTDGIHAALVFLNGCGAHRFSGIYRFDGDMLRNVHLVDRTDASVQAGPDAPMRETYCSIVARDRRPFRAVDTLADDRLADHPARRMVQSYCGVLLRSPDGTPFGSLCNFDLVPQPSAPAELAVLEAVAPMVSLAVAPLAS